MRENYWTVPREWVGQAAFIVAGGPSVAGQDVEALRGRRVIAIKSSIERVPWADVLFTAEPKWWPAHQDEIKHFAGRVVSVRSPESGLTPQRDGRRLWLRRVKTFGLVTRPDAVMVRRTSLTGAINLAFHFGANPIVLLGADGRIDENGGTHHHTPHPLRDGCFDAQRMDLQAFVEPLAAHGITVINASPGSAVTVWPVMTLEDALRIVDARALNLDRL